MKNDAIGSDFATSLEEILRTGARKLLQQAIENEVLEYTESHKNRLDEKGRQVIKRNGYLPKRLLQTGLGPIEIRQPRVRDKEYVSALLPKYLRRTPSIESLVPALYLKGISTGNMQEALSAILGENAEGLSPTNITRLTQVWEEEYINRTKRSLADKHYAYLWADGIYFNIRLSDERPCLLVLIGATLDGKKELLAIHDGIRESTLSWKEVLQNLKNRGLCQAPELGIGDGAMGFWAALEEEFPATKHQRCWVHKTANVLDKLPKSAQRGAKEPIHEMYMSPTKQKGLEAFYQFEKRYEAKYPKVWKCLQKDLNQLFTFYSFPAKHWQHIRSTNPIESMFATIRHRSRQTKGNGSVKATLSMVYKLGMEAEKKWKRLRGSEFILKLVNGVKFKDGEEVVKAA